MLFLFGKVQLLQVGQKCYKLSVFYWTCNWLCWCIADSIRWPLHLLLHLFFCFKHFLKGFSNIFKGIWKYFSFTTFHDLFEARRTTHQLQLTLDWLRKTVIIIMICRVGSGIFQDVSKGFNDRIYDCGCMCVHPCECNVFHYNTK